MSNKSRADVHARSPNSAELAKIVPLDANVKGFGRQQRKWDAGCRICYGEGVVLWQGKETPCKLPARLKTPHAVIAGQSPEAPWRGVYEADFRQNACKTAEMALLPKTAVGGTMREMRPDRTPKRLRRHLRRKGYYSPAVGIVPGLGGKWLTYDAKGKLIAASGDYGPLPSIR